MGPACPVPAGPPHLQVHPSEVAVARLGTVGQQVVAPHLGRDARVLGVAPKHACGQGQERAGLRTGGGGEG